MRDAVGEPVSVNSLDLAEPRAGEVLVRLRAKGVHHSDRCVIEGSYFTATDATTTRLRRRSATRLTMAAT